jgi:hypothetical protein
MPEGVWTDGLFYLGGAGRCLNDIIGLNAGERPALLAEEEVVFGAPTGFVLRLAHRQVSSERPFHSSAVRHPTNFFPFSPHLYKLVLLINSM